MLEVTIIGSHAGCQALNVCILILSADEIFTTFSAVTN